MKNTENLFEKISEKIKKERQSRGWSQEKLAQFSNTSLLTIGSIERLTSKPSLMTLAQIADAFEVELCDLLKF